MKDMKEKMKMEKMGAGKKMYKDDICDMEFDNKKDFDKHMKEYKEYHETHGKTGTW